MTNYYFWSVARARRRQESSCPTTQAVELLAFGVEGAFAAKKSCPANKRGVVVTPAGLSSYKDVPEVQNDFLDAFSKKEAISKFDPVAINTFLRFNVFS